MWIRLRTPARRSRDNRASFSRQEPPRRVICVLVAALCVVGLAVGMSFSALAQDDFGSGMNGSQLMTPPGSAPDESERMPGVPRTTIGQPVTASMMVSPPYGNAPLRVGFFVLASDPE